MGPSTTSTERAVGITQAHHGLPPGSPESGKAVPANSAAPLARGAGSLCQERGFLGPSRLQLPCQQDSVPGVPRTPSAVTV